MHVEDVINCAFFVKDQQKMMDLFGGFFKVFNQDGAFSALRTKHTFVGWHAELAKSYSKTFPTRCARNLASSSTCVELDVRHGVNAVIS